MLFDTKSKISRIKEWLSSFAMLSSLSEISSHKTILLRRIQAADALLKVARMQRNIIHTLLHDDSTFDEDQRELSELQERIRIWRRRYPNTLEHK